MPVHTTVDEDEIRALLDGALAADPLRNTVLSSVERGLRADDAAPWAAHPAGRPLVLAARSQIGTPVSLTSGWSGSAAAALSDALAELDPPPAAVMGPKESIAAVVVPGPVVGGRDERLFRLERLAPPAGVGGSPRLAAETDSDLLRNWLREFRRESLGDLPDGYDAPAELAQRWPSMRIWLWTAADGLPTSMAFAQPTAHGVARIGPVYTPPQRRRYGYGSAVTAAASADILDRPSAACLFTDLANPTSNSIYARIGYRPVCDFTELRLR